MTGFVLATSACVSCGKVFSFNPHKVPSIRIDGIREPVCLDCMTYANAQRVQGGLPPHPIQPDAYDPMPEEDL